MGVQQMLLAGETSEEPSVPIGGKILSASSAATTGGRTWWNQTYNVPPLWKEKTWRYSHYFDSSPSYNYAASTFVLEKNGVAVYVWTTPKSPLYPELSNSWFRDRDDPRTGSFDLLIAGGDVIRHYCTSWVRNNGSIYQKVNASLARLT